MENSKLIRIAQKVSGVFKEKQPYFIFSEIKQIGAVSQIFDRLEQKDIIKICFIIYLIKTNQTNFDEILWKIDNDSFTFIIGQVTEENPERECDTCYGTGEVECSECDGRGLVDCSDCDGTGEDSDGDSCEWCDGSGDVDCDICNSSGNETCDTCVGTGNVEEYGMVLVQFKEYFSFNQSLKEQLSEYSEYEKLSGDLVDEIEDDFTMIRIYRYDELVEESSSPDNLEYDDTIFYHINEPAFFRPGFGRYKD